MKKSREVRQAVYEPTKETIQFLFRGSGGLRVQEVEGGVTLDEWFASQADLVVGLDGNFTTLGGKVLNSKVGIGLLGLSGSVHFAWRHIVGRRRRLVTGVGHPGVGNLE